VHKNHKILLENIFNGGVINLEMSITRISVSVTLISAVIGPEVTFADRIMQLLTRETPDFFAATLWPANSFDQF